jgi:hypothetical protein
VLRAKNYITITEITLPKILINSSFIFHVFNCVHLECRPINICMCVYLCDMRVFL